LTHSTELAPLKDLGLSVRPEYAGMLSVIEANRENVALALQQHGKSHTQFQYAMLDNAGPVAGPTKLRNMRQILAVIERTEAALQEAYYKRREQDLDRQIAVSKAEREDDPLQRAKLELEAEKVGSDMARQGPRRNRRPTGSSGLLTEASNITMAPRSTCDGTRLGAADIEDKHSGIPQPLPHGLEVRGFGSLRRES
jgi:hypothetical protein